MSSVIWLGLYRDPPYVLGLPRVYLVFCRGTGLSPTPPVVQAVGDALGGDGEETTSMGHTVRVESAQVTEEVPRIQPCPLGLGPRMIVARG